MFGGVVGHPPRQADQTADGGAVDDGVSPALLAEHLLKFILHAEKHTPQIDVHHPVELGGFQFGGFHVVTHDSGVVVGAVEAAEGVGNECDHLLDLLLVGHVADGPGGVEPLRRQRTGNFPEEIFPPSRQNDRSSRPGEHLRSRPADPAGCSSNQSDFSIQFIIHCSFLLNCKFTLPVRSEPRNCRATRQAGRAHTL